MAFTVDERISGTCFELGDWPLSRVFLKNNAHYPWFILVPRQENVSEMTELTSSFRHVLMDEITAISTLTESYFKPAKVNVGVLGNIVRQLHVHVIARFIGDHHWPQGIWQAESPSQPYTAAQLAVLLPYFREQIQRYLESGF